MKNEPTRESIMFYIHQRKVVTTSDISSALGLTMHTIRYHIDHLIKDGNIERVILSSHEKRGRPSFGYRKPLSRRDTNYLLLSALLLEKNELSESVNQDLANLFLKKYPTISGPLPRRLSSLIQVLNQNHYESRWEAHARGPLVTFHNCPYVHLITQYPELCGLDRCILSIALERPVHQISKFEVDKPETSVCVFLLQ